MRMVELHNLRMALLPGTFSARKQLGECFRSAAAEPIVVVEMNTLVPMVELVRNTDLACIVAEAAVGDKRSGCPSLPWKIRLICTPGLLWKKGGSDDPVIRQSAAVVRRATESVSRLLMINFGHSPQAGLTFLLTWTLRK